MRIHNIKIIDFFFVGRGFIGQISSHRTSIASHKIGGAQKTPSSDVRHNFSLRINSVALALQLLYYTTLLLFFKPSYIYILGKKPQGLKISSPSTDSNFDGLCIN